MASVGEAEFGSLWGEEAVQAEPDVLSADLDRLRSVVEPVKDFADKHVAHLDYTPAEEANLQRAR
jgi:hypothetical protein